MNLKTKKNAQATGSEDSGFVYSDLPQVNLLPSEILDGRALKALKVRILYALGLVLVLIALGYIAAMLEKSSAEQRLQDATEQTMALKKEEMRYAEVPAIHAQIATAELALRDGMYREILWKDILGAISATIPQGGIVKTITVEAATPNEPGPGLSDDLQRSSIGELAFSVNFKEMPDTVAWINQLNATHGFADARLSAATHYLAPNGDDTYEFSGTVRLLEEIYSGRFEPTDEQTDEETAEETEAAEGDN